MERPVRAEGDGGTQRFVYFVIRIRRDAADTARGPAGLLERLGSGLARRFDGADELIELLADDGSGTSTSGLGRE